MATGDEIQELDAAWQAPSSNGGSAVTGYKVQWKEAADSWDTETDVSEAAETGTTYTITSLMGGVEYAVRVIATNDVGDGPASTEAKGTPAGGVSEQVVEPENSAPTGLPGISGTPQVDQTLTADTANIVDQDGLTNVSYSYQWIAGGTDIGGATGSTHTLTASEQGKTIKVRVTFTDDADNEETLTSEATVAVAAAPVPLTVSLTVAAPATHDGSSEFTFDIEFSEEFGLSYVTLKTHAFNVTGGSVERAQRTDRPSNIPWRITVKPLGNGDVTIELPATTDLRRPRGHLHRGRQDALQPAGVHRLRSRAGRRGVVSGNNKGLHKWRFCRGGVMGPRPCFKYASGSRNGPDTWNSGRGGSPARNKVLPNSGTVKRRIRALSVVPPQAEHLEHFHGRRSRCVSREDEHNAASAHGT